jgi:hypothetical protein
MPNNPAYNVAISLATGELQHFDTVGFLYIMESEVLEGGLKIGVTAKPPNMRAQELLKEFGRDEPFYVLGAWRFRNYRLAERFIQHCLCDYKQVFIKEVEHFNEARTGKPCKRTHRSGEVFKCSFDDAYKFVSQLLHRDESVFTFERLVVHEARTYLSKILAHHKYALTHQSAA